MCQYVIELTGLTKKYGDFTAVNDLNLQIRKGEIFGLLGPNGAGKSTTILMMLGLTEPTTGSVKVCDIDSTTHPIEVKRKVGYLPEDVGFYEDMTGIGTLVYTAALNGIRRKEAREKAERLLDQIGLGKEADKKAGKYSKGMRQRLGLADVLIKSPEVIILDEPTSQLDPIAASDFLETVKKINRDIGTTVIITEHRLQDIVPYADKAFVMDKGNVFLEGSPREIGAALREQKHGMFLSMPVPMQIYGATDSRDTCPLTVSEGRQWLERYCREKNITEEKREKINVDFLTVVREGEQQDPDNRKNPAIQLKDVWFRYEKDSPDVVRDLSLEVRKGEFYALVGGNGTGKSTTLSLLSRVRQPYRGKIRLEGRDIRSFKDRELYCGCLGVMPQNPQSIFLKKTVLEDLYSVIGGKKEKQSAEYQIHMKKEKAIEGIVSLTRLEGLLDRHPYDLSGGEQQRLALAKVLLLRPRILLMDEPTKGMDAEYKEEIGKILCKLKQHGLTIFMISHDVEFVAEYADRVGLFFEGNVVTSQNTREFFSGNNFYTTAANRMARQLFPDAVTGKDVITCLQKSN